jgi:L-threonylcarbamoyladenylate synthase
VSADPAAIGALRRGVLDGGLALVPTDTVYGLAAALDVEEGIAGLYALKGRPRTQPCQVLIYSQRLLRDALEALPESVARAAAALLPGPATCLVPDAAGRYAAAAGAERGSVGLRAPRMPEPFAAIDIPLAATSANHPGGRDPRRVDEVPADLRAGVCATVDLGELPGVASAVVDLRPVARGGSARLVRPGPDPAFVAGALAAVGCTLAP